jgi:hypothetical protein
MTWVAPPRPANGAALYAAAEEDRRAHPEKYRLDADEVVSRATRGDISAAEFSDGWQEGLAAYLESADADGRLNAIGRRMVRDSAVSKLVAGAKIARARSEGGVAPEALVAPPIVIVGGWRTGTTFLFRLLATDPRLRAPLPVELAQPWRLATLRGEEREAAIDQSAAAHEFLHLVNPQLQAVHDSGARLPEECVLGMGTDLRNWGFTATTRVDGYAEWLATQDLSATYRSYRRLLELLDDGDGRRWVLKAPAHTAEIRHLVGAFPGAVVVHLHRDIVETIASGASLFATFRSTYSDDVDPSDVGRFQSDQSELWLRRAVAARSDVGTDAATFLDLDYRALVGDTLATVGAIYAAADMDPPPDLDAFIAADRRARPRNAHGAHSYRPDDFGLDGDALRERFAFVEAIAP